MDINLRCVYPGRLEVIVGEERSAEAKEGDILSVVRSDKLRYYGTLNTPVVPFIYQCAVLKENVVLDKVLTGDFWALWEKIPKVGETMSNKQLAMNLVEGERELSVSGVEAYNEGKKAAKITGKSLRDNPYPIGSMLNAHWRAGYMSVASNKITTSK